MVKIAIGSELFTKVLYIALLYVSFLFSGYLEETLYKGQYDLKGKKSRFTDPLIAIFLNSLISFLISSAFMASLPKPKKVLFTSGDRLLLGIYYMCSRFSSEYSLKYLDYISKIIGKSCKSVSIIMVYFMYNMPVIGSLFKKLVHQKSEKAVHGNGYSDLIKVIITTLSIILFNFEEGSGNKSSSSDVLNSLLFGYGLLIVSLFFDGIMGLKEKLINHDVHHNEEYSDYKSRLSWEYMNLFSLYSLIFCSIGIGYDIVFNNFLGSLQIYMSNTTLVTNLVLYALMSSIGQVFLFQILEREGPLSLSIISGVRKIVSIALSIIIFGKTISFVKTISLLLGSTVILWEILEKSSKPGHGHHGHHNQIESEKKKE